MIYKRLAIVGGSRGLGAAIAREASRQGVSEVLIMSRRPQDFDSSTIQPNCKIHKWVGDAYRADVQTWVSALKEFETDALIYATGGGAYGNFDEKNWKDHEWSLKVTGLFPMELVHALARAKLPSLKQVCLVGSAIAESAGDPRAASYAAAKHLLLGFFKSVKAEGSLEFDLRLYSPGYMDTTMLPPNAWPRKQKGLVLDVDAVALDLVTWCSVADDSGYRSYK